MTQATVFVVAGLPAGVLLVGDVCLAQVRGTNLMGGWVRGGVHGASAGGSGRARARRVLRRGRWVVAAALAPVIAAGTSLVPAVVTAGLVAGVTAASVASGAAPAKAASGSVLVLLQNGETAAPEAADVPSGFTVTQVTPATWEGMTTAQFTAYSALVIGDPSSGGTCSSLTPTTATSGTDALGTNWQAAVSGNTAVLGTAPALPGTAGANALISGAIGYAAAGFSSPGTGTGLYVSLNCEYSTASAGTAVPLLNGVEGIGAAGGLTVQGGLACTDPGTVNTWGANSARTFAGFASNSLGTGSWPSPGCPVHEAFDAWPAMFIPMALDGAADAAASFTASDGATGQPYVLLGTPPLTSSTAAGKATLALAPSAGGEVPAGATQGGGNAAAAGLSQAMVADPVNTENGDFTQSTTDAAVSTYGPSLGFGRSYDAQVAEQQTEAGTPGPLGYGWTDSLATSLAASRPLPGDIYTLDGTATSHGSGGSPGSGVLDDPGSVFLSGSDVYIADADENRVEEVPGTSKTQWGIAMTAGDMYTIAGSDTGLAGASGNGTAAHSSLLDSPEGVAVDASGNVFIADTNNARVVELAAATGTQWGSISMTVNDLYVIAGRTGEPALGTDAKSAITSDLDEPEGIHFGGTSSEDLYIADTGNNRVQEIAGAAGENEWGQAMTLGDVYTVAGSPAGTEGASTNGTADASTLLNAPEGVTVSSAGDLYVADTSNHRIAEIADSTGTQWGSIAMTKFDLYTVAGRVGDGTIGTDSKPATMSDLWFPESVRVTNGQNMYISDSGNNRIQEVARTAHTEFGQSMVVGDVYTVAGSPTGTAGFSGNGGLGTSALLSSPEDTFLDSSGDIYIADALNNRVRLLSAATGDIAAYAGNGFTVDTSGNGGPATAAGLDNPDNVTSDSKGNVYIADSANNRVQEIPASTHTQFGIAMTAGDVYTVAGNAAGGEGTSGDGGLATSAFLNLPLGLAVDAAGDLYIVDASNNRVQKVAASTGDISTIAGSATGASGDSGDGGAATSALLEEPSGAAVDAAGDLYIADEINSRIQEVPAVAGTQWGQAMTAGDMYTVAGSPTGAFGATGDGGPARSALLSDPSGVAVDAAGDVYVSDTSNNRIQELAVTSARRFGQQMTAGDIYTIAGPATAATAGTSGDGGPGTKALLDGPDGIAADTSGDVFIADASNNRIQELAAASGTQWSTSMTAGDIYTVAGSAAGAGGAAAGDGGPATTALLDFPLGVGVDPAGNIYVIDESNNRLREVTATSAGTFPENPTPGTTVPGAVVIAQPGGAQITFSSQSGGTCAAPLVTAGGYCVLPAFQGATLTFNSTAQTYTYSDAPGSGTSVYSWDGQLISQTDTAGDTLTVTYQSPAPGSGSCPSTAGSCETVASASGRTLVVGSNSSGLVTSVTDPMGRAWAYGYTGSELTSATDPMGHKTTYTYGAGSTGNPLLANDLLTITGPNAQPGGPDAGQSTVNVYDSLGRVTQQTDPLGLKTTFNYCVSAAAANCMNAATGNGYVTVTDPDGNNTVFDYEQGTLAATTVWNGTQASENDNGPNVTDSGNAAGTLLPVWTTDADNEMRSTTYDQFGNTTSLTDPNGNVSTTWTTSAGDDRCSANALAATACSSSQPGPAPVAAGQVITPPSSAPPAGASYSQYDADGRDLYDTVGVYPPGSATASATHTSYTLYQGNSVTLNGTSIACGAVPPSASLPCADIDTAGQVTQLTYDSAGDLTSESTPDGNGSQLATETSGYNADGQETSETSPNGNVPGANAGNYTTTTAYNADGAETSETDAAGAGATVTPRTTSYGYDADGNQVTATNPRGFSTATTYDADDESVLVTNPAGNALLTCYDGNGDAVQSVPPSGVAANSLTPASCPTAYPAGYSDRLASDATIETYDATGQVVSQSAPAPAGQSGTETTTYTYDPSGLPLQVSAPPATTGGPNQVTVNTYDANGNLMTATSGSGTSAAATVSACYDPDGNRTAVIPPDANSSGVPKCETSSPWDVSSSTYPTQAAYQTTSTYDSAGDLVSSTSPATTAAPGGATTTYTYDSDGDQVTTTDPNGVTTTTAYTTPGGNVASVSFSGASAHSVSYTYDAGGDITGMTDGTGTSSNTYDPFGELTSTTNGAGQTVGYTYDAGGNTTGTTYPLPSTATWATSDTVSYGYDHANRLTSVTDFNGHQIAVTPDADGTPSSATLGSTGDTISYTYDPTGSPSAVALQNSTSTLQSFTYSDAPDGGILSEADVPASAKSPAAYTYDAQGRVTSMTPGTGSALDYAFDAASNLTTLPNGATATYDHAGELASAALSGTTTSYSYNADGERLNSQQGSATITSGTWNGAGQLTSYNGTAADMTAATYDGSGMRASDTTGSGTQHFLWGAGSQLLMDSANAYIYALGNAPTEQVNLSTGAATYLNADALGSVRGVVASSGALSATTSYDAWGNPQTTGGLTSSTPFGYAGGYTDPTGLLYLINRYYDPSTGQFTSVDPDASQTGEPYGYAGGDPVNGADPDGLWMIGLPSTESDFANEPRFVDWVQGIIGGLRMVDFYKSPKKGGAFRQVDIFQNATGWMNETKIGRQKATDENKTQATKDSDMLKDPGGYCYEHTFGHDQFGCKSVGLEGGVWWFGYKGASGCQRTGALDFANVCPNAALRNYLLNGSKTRRSLNVVLVWYYKYRPRRQPPAPWSNNFDYLKSINELYKDFKTKIRQTLDSNKCPEGVLDSGILPVIKFPGHGCGTS
jgi:RHS repeat-associated protein